MNLLSQLVAAKLPPPEEARKLPKNHAVHAARKANTARRYREAFGGQDRVTKEIAVAIGITPVGCLNMLMRMEKAGQVMRVGTKPTGGSQPTIVWRWIDAGT